MPDTEIETAAGRRCPACGDQTLTIWHGAGGLQATCASSTCDFEY